MIVHCAGATTRQCAPGDIVTIAGIFLPTRYTVRRAFDVHVCVCMRVTLARLVNYPPSTALTLDLTSTINDTRINNNKKKNRGTRPSRRA